MNAKAETGMSMMDTLKLLIATLMVAGGVWGFYQFEDQVLAPIRVLGLVAVIALALFTATLTDRGRAAVAFMKAANIERQKVVWPTRNETVQTTMVVIVVVILVGLLIWLLDWIFASSVSALVG
jgi:preprotein translocase subunit SecE